MISKWVNNIPIGRPIINNRNTELSHISKFIENILHPYTLKLPHVIANSVRIIHDIGNIKNQNYILFTGDVESLYTNMCPHKCVNMVNKLLKNDPKKI